MMSLLFVCSNPAKFNLTILKERETSRENLWKSLEANRHPR